MPRCLKVGLVLLILNVSFYKYATAAHGIGSGETNPNMPLCLKAELVLLLLILNMSFYKYVTVAYGIGSERLTGKID